MNIFTSVLKDFVRYFKPVDRVRRVRLLAVFVVVVVGAAIVFAGTHDTTDAPEPSAARGVTVKSLTELRNADALSLVGTVKAVNQATIQAEVGGRITRVNVELGDTVAAGTVLATVENASEYASLLQAEGAYEAAVANAEQTGFSVETSQETLTSAVADGNDVYRSAYVTVANVLNGTVNGFFNGTTRSSLDLDDDLWEKKLIEYAVADWQTQSQMTQSQTALTQALTDAENLSARMNALIDIIYNEVVDEENGADTTTRATLATYKTNLTTARTSVTNAIASLRAARLDISQAQTALTRSEASSQGGAVSAADAQVKQALGSLRSAQAVYNKTILTSPIAGEVQSLTIDAGDYITAGSVAATIANDSALEITTYVSERESERITVGDSVTLEGGAAGTITAIAPAIDPTSGKIEVKISSTDTSVTNGARIRLDISSDTAEAADNAPIVIPITALKVETDRTIIFTVTNDNTLAAHEVETGALMGTHIVIESGIDRTAAIVVDARGLNEGDVVEVLQD